MSGLVEIPEGGWEPDDTERWLSLNPLPPDFKWPHRQKNADDTENWQPVLPSYRLHKGYGFWLRTTPYFPGLFEEVHAILLGCGDELPTADDMTKTLLERHAARGQQQKLFT